jgi:type I restriction enzyme, R subunit
MHLEQNGTIEAGMLFESPFTNVNDQGLPGVFDEAASTRIIHLFFRMTTYLIKNNINFIS